jgi:threonyl-tRNA synthetase
VRVFLYYKGKVRKNMTENNNSIEAVRHSLSHLLAYTVKQLYPGSQNAIGPAIENGFYQDFEVEGVISEEDLPKIEKKMKEVLKTWNGFERKEVSLDEALEIFADNKYKQELAREFAEGGKTLTIYTSGEFVDLCKGGHVDDISSINPEGFKITTTAGAYWRGDEKNIMLTRIYGVAFTTKQELTDYLQMQEEAKSRDHRKLGKDLELFFMHETAPGMPYWLPNGTIVYNELINFWREEHNARGYLETISPLLNKKELYITSGHFEHYWDDMFSSETEEGELYGLKAMNCPNAMVIYKSKSRSYRDLPLKFSDTDTLHRNELSGTLNGLLRVREFRQDDAHIFVNEDQIKDEYKKILDITERFYSIFNMEYSFRLGTRPDKFMGEPKLWDKAEQTLQDIIKESGKDYFIEEGDGAFYGPKIDILMKDVLGRSWQMGTIQLDFQQPLRFKLEYTDKDGIAKTPIAIHRVIYGSMERFIGILIEHLAGKFPVWLAPEQLRIIQVKDSDELNQFVDKIAAIAMENNVRVHIDRSNESVGKKIRAAEMMKVPYSVVIGEKELETSKLSPRIRSDLIVEGRVEAIYPYENLILSIANEARGRVQKSSL